MGIYYYSHWGHLVQTPQISSGFKDKNSRALVFSRVFCFSLNVRQSLAWCPSLLPAAMTIVAILASSRSFSPPGSLLPISYPCMGRLGVRAPSGNYYYPPHSAQSANENTTTYMECDSCWVPNGHNGPAHALLTRYLSNTVQQYK